MADSLKNSGLFPRKNKKGQRILDRYKKIWGLRPFPIGFADFKMPRCAAQAQSPFGLTDHPPFRPIASRWLLKRLIADEMHFKVANPSP
jgi:hypothetical protein